MMINLEEVLGLDTNKLNIEISDFPKQVLLYGAGGLCEFYIRLCRSHGVEPIVCDSSPKKFGAVIKGITIIAYNDEFLLNEELKIIITTPTYYEEIKTQVLNTISEERFYHCHTEDVFKSVYFDSEGYKDLLKDNIDRLNNIYEAFSDDESRRVMLNVIKGNYSGDIEYFNKIYSGDQYFPKDIIKLSKNEVFIDGGAYDGDTIIDFIKATNGSYERIYSFEPTKSLFDTLIVLKEGMNENQNKLVLFNKGLFDVSKTIGFTLVPGLHGANHINDRQNYSESAIEVVGVDEVIEDKVTFIKLDIEGSELKALEGAKKTILNSKPKLAICVYHKPEDIIVLPEFIMNLGLDYKYYLRHHFKGSNCETVFYAV